MKDSIVLILLTLSSFAFAEPRPSKLDPKPAAEEAKPKESVVGLWHAEGSRGWKGPLNLLPDGTIASGGKWRVRGNKLICDYGGGKEDVYDLPAKDGVITGKSFRGTTLKATKQSSAAPAPPVKAE